MLITITLDTAGAAFDEEPGAEVQDALRGVCNRWRREGFCSLAVLDRNGNTCGRAEVTEDGESVGEGAPGDGWARCACGRVLNPAARMMGDTCGACVRKAHAEAVGRGGENRRAKK